MNDHQGYEYMDEASIDDEFKCLICNEPFEKPMCTPCDHTFCQLCIHQWLQKCTSENTSCPTCRKPLSMDKDLKPASRIITNRIDRYLVRCLKCKVDGIPRGSFPDHISKSCEKTTIPCLASDLSCPWKGLRGQLDDHLKRCSYQQIRPALESLQAKNNHLEQLLIGQQQQINELMTIMKSMKGLNNLPIKRTLNFDDLIERNTDFNTYHRVPSSYAGFRWHNGAFMPRQHGQTSYPNTGFATAFKKDQKCVVFNFGSREMTIRDPHNTFSIVSFEAACAFQDQVILTVSGQRANKTIYTTAFTLRSHELQVFHLNWSNIDQFEFLPSGGQQLPSSTDTDRHVVLTYLNFG